MDRLPLFAVSALAGLRCCGKALLWPVPLSRGGRGNDEDKRPEELQERSLSSIYFVLIQGPLNSMA